LPPLLEKSERRKGTWYSNEIGKILEGVPKERGGWYVWGKFNDAAWWQPIYVGMASIGKKEKWGLFSRLYDELREEGFSMFAAVYGRDAVTTAARKLLKGTEYFKQGESVQRALRKTDTQFIIWTTAPFETSAREYSLVENALIHYYRPSFNSKRPTPQELHAVDSNLFDNARRQLDEEIEKMRGAFKI
jgi:hypothetical protein